MKKSMASLLLLSLICTGVPTKQVHAQYDKTRIALGATGAVAGAALGIYLHKVAGKNAEQLELLELLKKYMTEDTFRSAPDAGEKARQEIERQHTDAMKALKEDVVDLAIGTAEKILTQAIDKSAHKKVIDEYIGSMPKSQKN